jgi:hypothetical protein
MGEQEKHHWNVVFILSDGRTIGWQMMCSTLDMVTEEVREFAADPCNILGKAKIAKVYAGSETHRLMKFPVEDFDEDAAGIEGAGAGGYS